MTKRSSTKAKGTILPRSDAFFGLHFDLHPQETDTSLGADITEGNIAKLLKRVRPDYVQYDCKGHAGWTGYPTKVGWASPGIVQDSLAIWREVTREYGVGLFIHYSGVWDTVACRNRPEWARVDAEGNPDPNNTSVFGAYADELMIPQLKEVAEAYDLDGVWVDGDCWAVQLDYSAAALEAWRAETGYEDAPKDRSDPRWLEWKNFHRRAFERYVAKWVTALHEFRPGFQCASNWFYTTMAPKRPEAPVDFISGDYSPMASVDRARCDARYMAQVGLPWDLMAWGFNWGQELGSSLKPAVALQQEAAVVLMQGGGFQIYYNPTRSGYIVDQIIETAGQVADFCRARQKWCQGSVSVPQVALLLSAESQFDRSDAVFTYSGCLDELEGALHALLELHYSVDILAEWNLEPRLAEYPLVVIADAHKLPAGFREALLGYVQGGGKLLLLGQRCARLFEDVLGVEFEGEPEQVTAELEASGGLVNCNGVWQKIRPVEAKVIAHRWQTRDTRKESEPAATVTRLGRGRIAAVYGPVALAHFRTHHPGLRHFIGDIVASLFPEPRVEVDGPACVDVALRRAADGRLCVHLLNLAEAQRADRFLAPDFIPTVGPIKVRLSLPYRPQKIRWQPDGGKVRWTWKRGVVEAEVPSLHIHGVLVVE
ncbi:MAG: hypothetical protein N2512_06255 [Armatimonadetes bacterium]|nr:hypothetical protein [Armatimonadota bacterium]